MYILDNVSYISQYLFWNYLIYVSYNPLDKLMNKYISN